MEEKMINDILQDNLIQGNLKNDDFVVGKNWFYKLERGEASFEEYEKEIAYFAVLCGFEEIAPKPMPRRPDKLFQYDGLSLNDKKDIKDKFWQDEEIYGYVKSCNFVSYCNRANVEWLYYLSCVLAFDSVILAKIQSKLNEFRLAMGNYNRIIELYKRKMRLPLDKPK